MFSNDRVENRHTKTQIDKNKTHHYSAKLNKEVHGDFTERYLTTSTRVVVHVCLK